MSRYWPLAGAAALVLVAWLAQTSSGLGAIRAPRTPSFAHAEQPFTISRVKAVFNQQKFETTYTVDVTTPPFEKAPPKLTASWTLKITCIDRGCGTKQGTDANPAPNQDPGCDNAGVGTSKPFEQKLAPTEGAPFIWHHPSPGIIPPYHCDHSKQGLSGHQGLIAVTVTGADWTCTAQLGGTESYNALTDSVQAGEARKGTAPECKKTQAAAKPDAILEHISYLLLKRKGFERGLDLRHAFNPKTGVNVHWDSDKKQWIDSKTGAALTPILSMAEIRDGLYAIYLQPKGFERGLDLGHAFNPKTGVNAHWDPHKKQWIDSKSGKPVSPDP